MGKLLITGGAGFIGVNSAFHFSKKGWKVVILDNLSRPGANNNLQWITDQCKVEFVKADIRDSGAMVSAVQGSRPDVVLHLAGQVAADSSADITSCAYAAICAQLEPRAALGFAMGVR